MRLPNNYGSITKMQGARRKPYRVRVLIGYVDDDERHRTKAVYRNVGYAGTRTEAMQLLAAFHSDPTDAFAEHTLKDVYDLWFAEHCGNLAKGTKSAYSACFASFSIISSRKIKSLKTDDFEPIIHKQARSMRHVSKVLLTGVYDYALRHDFVSVDYSKKINYKEDRKTEIRREIYSPEEIAFLRTESSVYARFLLILIYTGFRPSELLSVTVSDVNLDCDCPHIIGGMKTEAGKNRAVPIHPDILSVVSDRVSLCRTQEKTLLFPFSYGTVLNHAEALSDPFGKKHKPHDARHTFATAAKKSGMDESAVKRIMGHALTDLTDRVYTHLDIGFLYAEMLKYNPCL